MVSAGPWPRRREQEGRAVGFLATAGEDRQVGQQVSEAVQDPVGAGFEQLLAVRRAGRHGVDRQAGSPGRLDVEARIAPETRAALAKLGHVITDWPDYDWRAGAVCASVVGKDGVRLGGADPRRGAHAIGW